MDQSSLVAKRMKDIRAFHVMDILAKAKAMEKQGQTIIHMEVGEPDFESPQAVLDAGIAAIKAGKTHYTPAKGLLALREKICEFYRQRYDIDVPINRIMITPGASGALQLLMGSMVDPNDEVLLTDPGYPCNRHFVRLFEGKAVVIPVDATSNFQPTTEQIEKNWSAKTKALLLASPSNPAGSLLSSQQIQNLYRKIADKQGIFIVDEIYHGLVYDQKEATALSISENIFVINSFSKYFGMTGWRLGWMVVPSAYVDELEKLAQNVFLAAPTPAQYAALAAFSEETLQELDQRRHILGKRRDYLYAALLSLGFSLAEKPEGAFYIYADCTKFTNDSFQFCHDVLENTGVAITPGIDFGDYKANEYVRFAYTVATDKMEIAIERLREYLLSL